MSIKYMALNPEQIELFYQNNQKIEFLPRDYRLRPNDYCIYTDNYNLDEATVIAITDYNRNVIGQYDVCIKSNFGKNIRARNPEQACAIDLLKKQTVPVKFITGRAGSGKDYLISSYAAEKLRRGDVQQIVFIRNNIQLSDTKDIGALPGDLNEKTDWMSAPLRQAIGDDEYQIRMSNGQIVNEFLGHIRGRSYSDSIVIVTEAQNLTQYHIGLIMSRIGERSELIINGDFVAQRDSDVFRGGLEKAIEILENSPESQKYVGNVELRKCERGKVASLAGLLGA